jgi:eukaryotic-like serine/threonine-protein kinase
VTIRDNPPLEQVTTGSLAALKKYSDGARLIDLGFAEGAVPVLEEAIALDTGFAMAYRKLAVAIFNSSGSVAREVAAARRAYQLRERLPETERDLATANYFEAVEYDPAKVTAAYQSILKRDPDQDLALNNLALFANFERRYAEAESLASRTFKTGNTTQSFDPATMAQVAQGHWADAHATLERMRRAHPRGSPAVMASASYLALAERDYAAADSMIKELRQAQRASPEWQARTALILAGVAETQGRLRDAAARRREFMAASEARDLANDYITGAKELAMLELRYRNRPAEGLALVQRALSRYPLASMPAADRPYLTLADLYAVAGMADKARRLLGEYEDSVPVGLRRTVRWAGAVYGRVLEAEGKPSEAAEQYRAFHDRTGGCGNCGLFELARLYDRQGETDSARVLFERFVNTPTMAGRFFADPEGLAPSYKRLGELYEAKGDRKKAAEYYGQFAELWKNADPELQPGVKEVRQRLARLAQEGGA